MDERRIWRARSAQRGKALFCVLAVCGIAGAASTGVAAARQDGGGASPTAPARSSPATLEETRLALDEWLQTQQLLSRERKEWQQGREILAARIELAQQEVATLTGKIKQAETNVAEADRRKAELVVENDALKVVGEQLAGAAGAMEKDVQRLLKQLPDPLQKKLAPLRDRIPADPLASRASAAERFQNVLGILNAVNQANSEITVEYEVHQLADGKPSEVRALYVGLAQAWFVGAAGEAGVGRPTEEGWKWQPAPTLGRDILLALDIAGGKQSPAFVPLPARFQ